MRVQTEEWRRFIPGVRLYKGKKTLFYNGENLYDKKRYHIYDYDERQTWEVIMTLPGVEIIHEFAFYNCRNVKTVIMNDSVKRIHEYALAGCESLEFVKLSTNLEYILFMSFAECYCLTSIFIPPSCREIGDFAFQNCTKLIIFQVPRQTQLGENVITGTALIRASHFKTYFDCALYENHEEVNQWIKDINGREEEYALHRACSSFNPLEEIIHAIFKREGFNSFKNKIASELRHRNTSRKTHILKLTRERLSTVMFLI